MSFAGTREPGKSDSWGRPGGMAEEIGGFVRQAAPEGTALREFERELFDRLLKMGHAATELFLALQGDGDRGETVADEEGRTLYRSEQPARRPLRTIFGEHCFAAYVYRRRPHPNTPIALRPVDEWFGIEPDRWSPLLQEFAVMFAIEQPLGPAAFGAIFRQRLSVDTLQKVSRRMGERAGEFLDALPPPPSTTPRPAPRFLTAAYKKIRAACPLSV